MRGGPSTHHRDGGSGRFNKAGSLHSGSLNGNRIATTHTKLPADAKTAQVQPRRRGPEQGKNYLSITISESVGRPVAS